MDKSQVAENGTQKAGGQLAVIFAKMNMSELPAMSGHVQELISLTHSRRSAAYELSKVILKDYSLTNKVLQVVNSAFYSLGRPVSSISRAVTILGFDAVRDLAMAIALFEDFIKSGVEKEGISKILTRSFLSALQARELVGLKKLKVPPEEAFICTLLYNLGRIIVCIYLPDKYHEIEAALVDGLDVDKAARDCLDNLTFSQVGEEVAKFWNLSDMIVACMNTSPEPPRNNSDAVGNLQNLADFTNRLVDTVCAGGELMPLLSKYSQLLPLDEEEAVALMNKSIDASEDISESMRYGLSRLKIRSRLQKLEMALKGEEPTGKDRDKRRKPDVDVEVLDDLPVSKDKSVNDFIREIADTLTSDFKLNDFYLNLVEALYRGVGFDRIILAIVSITPTEKTLVGRFGLGDIEPEDVGKFVHSLAGTHHAVARSFNACEEMTVSYDGVEEHFPENLKFLVKNRTVYLLPICIKGKGIGMIYMDRKAGRAMLDVNEQKAVQLFRDLAVMAIQKLYTKG